MENVKYNSNIDRVDKKLMEILRTDGRMPVTELAKKLGISKTPCGVRLRKLISEEIILGFRAVLNPKKLDMNYVAWHYRHLIKLYENCLKLRSAT